jgi:hypothetical protein
MRSLIVLALVACGKSAAPPPPEPTSATWWCWPETACFALKARCEAASIATKVAEPCTPRATAFCTTGCSTTAPGTRPSCSPLCGVDRAACTSFPNPETCTSTPPPKHPELFPRYSEPGWWCWSLTGGNGSASECTKAKAHCDFDLADTLAKLGQPPGGATCHRPTSSPFCWSWKLDDELDFVCTVTREHCEAARAMVPPVAPGHTRTDPTPCTPWSFE